MADNCLVRDANGGRTVKKGRDLTMMRSGTQVSVRLDDGSFVRTQTRSMPWKLGSGIWVVSLCGFSGGYDLKRVRPVEVDPESIPERRSTIGCESPAQLPDSGPREQMYVALESAHDQVALAIEHLEFAWPHLCGPLRILIADANAQLGRALQKIKKGRKLTESIEPQ